MPESTQTAAVEITRQSQWNRTQATAGLGEYEVARKEGISQRQFARERAIPRTTLQYWKKRQASIEASPAVISFFESPEGLLLLHQLVMAAHLAMTALGACGVRLVCRFLELSGLSAFVASSYGSQYKVSVEMEQGLVRYGEEQGQSLGAQMEAKEITSCLDETFHPEVCLVGIEPASNFILLEAYMA